MCWEAYMLKKIDATIYYDAIYDATIILVMHMKFQFCQLTQTFSWQARVSPAWLDLIITFINPL